MYNYIKIQLNYTYTFIYLEGLHESRTIYLNKWYSGRLLLRHITYLCVARLYSILSIDFI